MLLHFGGSGDGLESVDDFRAGARDVPRWMGSANTARTACLPLRARSPHGASATGIPLATKTPNASRLPECRKLEGGPWIRPK
jgi:hypothetical protein